MNPPERHLTAVPDAPADPDTFPGTPALSGDHIERILRDTRNSRRGKSKTLEDARAAGEVPVVADRQRMFDQAERARAALARTKPAPGPHADAHMRGYRRGGKRRKRELAADRAIMAEGLTVVREVRQAARRAQRAARA